MEPLPAEPALSYTAATYMPCRTVLWLLERKQLNSVKPLGDDVIC
jgi:hypothetical protein